MNFKSDAAYKAWLAYGHASGEFAKTPGNQPVSIKGKSHGVQHAFGGEMYAAGGSFNNPGFAKLPKDVQAKIKARSFASGGPMAQLTEFTEGGRHEENPIGGIPQGFAPDGQPNLVEQGETKLNGDNYIYSDTLKVTKDIALDFSLPKNSVGKTFAEVSKEANRPKSRRENDTIEEIATKRDLDNLMQAQEEFKKRDLEKDMQMMMEKHPQEMQQMMAGAQGMPQEGPPQEGMMPGQEMQGPPQEMAPEGQVPQSAEMGMPQGQPMDPNQMPPEMLAQMQGAQQGAPIMRMGGNMYMCGGKMYDFGGWMDENNAAVGGAAKGALSGAGTGASIGSAIFPVVGTAVGAIGGAIVGGLTGGIKGHKADAAENAADAEAARFATSQSQAMNANALMPDMNTVVNNPYQETISPMGMTGQSYDAGGWMNSNANAIGSTGEGMMLGAGAGLEAGKQFDVPGQTPWGSIIGAGVGAIGGGIGGVASGRQEDEQARMQQQAMYDQGKMQRNQSNMMINAPQMYQQQMMNQMNGAQMAKYGGRQYAMGGATEFENPAAAAMLNKNPGRSTFGANYNIGAKPTGGPGGGAQLSLPDGRYANDGDSLAAMHRAQSVENFYKNKGYVLDNSPRATHSLTGKEAWNTLKNTRQEVYQNTKKNNESKPLGVGGSNYQNFSQYYQEHPTDKNKFYQRETQVKLLDTKAPMMMYDTRIDPQEVHTYRNENGDIVSIPFYNKLATTPANKLNEAQLKERVEKFGTSGIPESWLKSHGYSPTSGSKTKVNSTIPQTQQPVAEPAVQAPAEDMTIGTLPLRPLENIPLNGPSPQEMAWIKQYHHPEKNMFGNPKRGERGYYEEMQVPADSKEAQTYFTQHYTSPESVNFFKNYPHLAPGATMQSDGTKRGHIPLADPSGIIQPYRQFDTAGAFPYGTQPATTVIDNSLNEPTSLGLTPPEGMKVNPLTGKTFATGGFLDSDFSLYGNPEAHSFATGGFEGDPVKGDLRTNDAGKTEVYTGTEWTSIDNYKEPIKLNIDTNPPKKSENFDDFNKFDPKEIVDGINSNLATDLITNSPARSAYLSELDSLNEETKDKNLDLEINQSLPEFLASAAPAAYNLGQGIFGKAQQLNPQDYMIGANMQPYQYNINPQLREADQSFAQGQEAVRNAGLSGGNYVTNMQQLANSRNQAIGGLYAQKQNADAESYNQAMSQNKEIEAQNLERKMGILDFNLKSKAAKNAMLQTGLTQLAQVSEGSQSKKLQLALMKALAPDFAGTMAYNSIADQYLNKMKEKKKAKATDKTKG